MKDYVNIDINSELDNIQVHSVLSRTLPDFTWRMGDSDMQGGYVSGRSEAGVYIQCWTGESPFALTLSFSGATLDETAQNELLNRIDKEVVPCIGNLTAFNYR